MKIFHLAPSARVLRYYRAVEVLVPRTLPREAFVFNSI